MSNYNYLRFFKTRSTRHFGPLIFISVCAKSLKWTILTIFFNKTCLIDVDVYYSYDFILCNWRVSLFLITVVWLFGLLCDMLKSSKSLIHMLRKIKGIMYMHTFKRIINKKCFINLSGCMFAKYKEGNNRPSSVN